MKYNPSRMKYNPESHHRRSIRLQGYDYSSAGAYFVTLCTQNHECLFGEISNRKMILNAAGQMVSIILQQIPDFYPDNDIDEFIVMPDHIHTIIIVGAGPRVCPITKPSMKFYIKEKVIAFTWHFC